MKIEFKQCLKLLSQAIKKQDIKAVSTLSKKLGRFRKKMDLEQVESLYFLFFPEKGTPSEVKRVRKYDQEVKTRVNIGEEQWGRLSKKEEMTTFIRILLTMKRIDKRELKKVR